MQVRPLESLTKEELIELIKQVSEETSDSALNTKYTDGYISGYVVACNFAASLAAETWVNHVFHTGLDGLIERCKNMEQVLLEKAQACRDSESHAKIKQSQMGYGGYMLVPLTPTEEMLSNAMNTGLYYDCEENAKAVLTDEYKAMLAAAHKQFEKPMKNYHYQPIATGEKEAPFEIPEPPKSKEPTDSEMWDWLIEESCTVLSFATGVLSRKYKVIDFQGDDVSVGDTAREAITKAMRGLE